MDGLISLCNEIKGCKKCDLHLSRKTAVCGIGDRSAEVMIVGEAPGSNEDQTGVPFVGRSGKLLDKMLIEANLPRSRVYITNAVRCRPKIGRTPKITEIRKCTPFLSKEIETVGPVLIIPMGNVAVIPVRLCCFFKLYFITIFMGPEPYSRSLRLILVRSLLRL